MPLRYLEDYVAEMRRIGLAAFSALYRSPTLIGLDVVAKLEERRRDPRRSTMPLEPLDVVEGVRAESLVHRVWPIRKGDYGPRGAGITVGRSTENDLVIAEYSLSDRHCEFRYEATRIVLIDLGSLNGTYWGRQRLRPQIRHPLKDGDRITLGRFQFEFLLGPAFVKRVSDLTKKTSDLSSSRGKGRRTRKTRPFGSQG